MNPVELHLEPGTAAAPNGHKTRPDSPYQTTSDELMNRMEVKVDVEPLKIADSENVEEKVDDVPPQIVDSENIKVNVDEEAPKIADCEIIEVLDHEPPPITDSENNQVKVDDEPQSIADSAYTKINVDDDDGDDEPLPSFANYDEFIEHYYFRLNCRKPGKPMTTPQLDDLAALGRLTLTANFAHLIGPYARLQFGDPWLWFNVLTAWTLTVVLVWGMIFVLPGVYHPQSWKALCKVVDKQSHYGWLPCWFLVALFVALLDLVSVSLIGPPLWAAIGRWTLLVPPWGNESELVWLVISMVMVPVNVQQVRWSMRGFRHSTYQLEMQMQKFYQVNKYAWFRYNNLVAAAAKQK